MAKYQREFEVERIEDERLLKNGNIEYFIKWRTYPSSENTWEPRSNLCEKAGKVIEDWEKNKKRGIPPKKRRRRSPSPKSESRKSARPDSEESTSATAKQIDSQLQISQRLKRGIDRTADHPDRKEFLRKLEKLDNRAKITIFNDLNEIPSPPLSFQFVKEYLYRPGVDLPDEDFIYGCQCQGKCALMKAGDCLCTEHNHEALGRQFMYKKNQTLREPGESRFTIHECNKKCSCGIECPNRVVGRGRQIPIEIFMTKDKGWGLRSPIDLKAGTFVETYVGEVITPEEAAKRSLAQYEKGLSYLFDLDKFKSEENQGPFYTVDGGDFGGIARFINHSCDPNTLVYAVTRDRADFKVYDLALFTRVDIPAWTELTFQYVGKGDDDDDEDDNDDEDEEKERHENDGLEDQVNGKGKEKKGWPCHCGAANCVGWLW